MALSDTKVRSLKPRDKLYKVSDDRGLYLEVTPNGSRLWRYRYFLHGKDKRIALGAYPVVGLADARRKRDDGVDPVLGRKREKPARWFLRQLSPIAKLPIADIKPLEVLAALKKLEKKGNHETARRCRSFASRVFRYGVATGRGEADPGAIL